MRSIRRSHYCLWLSLGLISASSASQAEDWSLCPPVSVFVAPEVDPELPQGTLTGSARELQGEGSEAPSITLLGDVLLEDETRRLQADEATYNQRTGDITLRGDVKIQEAGSLIEADYGQFNQLQQLGNFENARFRLQQNGGRSNGSATSITSPAENVTDLENAIYTTCEPQDPEWAIHSNWLRLDRNEGIGTAKHLRLHLLDVPVFYWPYISFPIDDRRKTGLLFPTFGSTSDSGYEFSQPFYWNIHPQADATITPRFLQDRGTQLQTEWRYLDKRFGDFELDLEYLDDREFGDERWLYGFTQSGNLSPRWSSYARIRRVSDDTYLEDLSNSLALGTPQHLRSEVGANYAGVYWTHHIGFERFQTLDPTLTQPHRRLPFIRSRMDYSWGNYDLNIASELVNYQHDTLVEGQRLDLYPSISRTFGSAGWFIKPKLGLRYTRYALDNLNATGSSFSEDAPSRTTPIASLDSGLVFERSLSNGLIQTLEPRLYALYVPEREQSQLPLFDTSVYTFSYAQLFRENRFTGADRQGDAEQITLGLTSRVIDDKNGAELLTASLGQIFYFADREVTLAETTTETENQSDIAADVRVRPHKSWALGTAFQYDPHDGQSLRRNSYIRYKPGDRSIINLGYRFTRNELEQSEVSAIWPIHRRWTVMGRWLYDLEDYESIETFGGLEYQSCCWSVSVIGRRQLENDVADSSIFVQFTLKGLGDIGRDTDSLLERGILGYQND